MPLTDQDRNGLAALLAKVELAQSRISGEITGLEISIADRQAEITRLRKRINELSSAKESIELILRIGAEL